MDTSTILAVLSLGEEKDWEFKAARSGLAGSVWDTDSAMANTDGGVVVLGIAQKDGRFAVEGVPDATKMKQDFWNTVNNRGKVSTNLLSNDEVTIESIHGQSVIVVRIPRATRRQRPVYVGQNPIKGTFLRYQEGDASRRCRQSRHARRVDERQGGRELRVQGVEAQGRFRGDGSVLWGWPMKEEVG